MNKRLLAFVVASLMLTGCQMRLANRLLRGGTPPADFSTPTPYVDTALSQAVTGTPVPSPTITATPLPDLGLIGLPLEPDRADVLDFAVDACRAEWSNSLAKAPCDEDQPAPSSGYATTLTGEVQGLPASFNLLLTYPPRENGDTLFGKYPAFTVQKGDRFRAVLSCRAHTFCDVEFGLEYYGSAGRAGLARWPFLFTDAPRVIDYPLDGIAGLTVQFSLVARRHGEGQQAYAVWIMPHIYRPVP